MEWSIVDESGKFLCEANCQYDCYDLSTMMYNATELKYYIEEKKCQIISREED
ncbi:hypothetical protein [Priestia flexa]|uniref:hypothetical protein n=1 Tax=Priestia flexa TaxID=86664 RepID=UPI000B27DD53|nr:hypothetical protein [Priestia flexa]